MCAIFGFLDYGKKIPANKLKKLINALAVNAEVRGTDATGISYVKNSKIMTFKKAKPAHKLNLYFPKNTTAVIGHTRFTTQGSAKKNYNNHPFEGRTENHNFSLAHNGVIYSDKELKQLYGFKSKIETDSYIAVQLLEYFSNIDENSIKSMAETVTGSFVFTILRDDNTLFLVKGNNPITLYHFPKYGLYVYASTKEILDNSLLETGFAEYKIEKIIVNEGDIIRIDSDGKISVSCFESYKPEYDWFNFYDDTDYENDLLMICNCYGVDCEDVELLLEYGYTSDEIEDMLFDTEYFESALKEAKTLQGVEHKNYFKEAEI